MLCSLVRRAWFGAPDSAPCGSPVARRGARIRETFGRAHRNMALTDVAFDEVLVAAAVEQRPASTPVKPAEDGLAAVPRSEERRGGTVSVSTCRSRWAPSHQNKKHTHTTRHPKDILIHTNND